MDQNVKMRPKHPLFRNRAKLAKKNCVLCDFEFVRYQKKKKSQSKVPDMGKWNDIDRKLCYESFPVSYVLNL